MAKHTFKENVLRLVAVIGLLAILLLGAWGIIQLAFFISSIFNNAGGAVSNTETPAQHETLTISVPANSQNGSPITVSWGHQGGSGAYAYNLSYSCVDGVTFKAPVPTGTTQTVPCNTPFNYTQATQNMQLTPVYSGTTDAKVTITVTATRLSTGAVTATASAATTIAATKKTTTTTTTTTKSTGSTYYASGRTSNLYGYSDLAVRILSATSRSGNATVQFEISNVGTNVSPSNWSFNALLPMQGTYTYPSGPQQALYPGDRIVYTLRYSDYGTGSGQTYGTCNQFGPCSIPGYSGGLTNYPPTYTQYGSGYGPYGYQKNITIVVDQFNQIYEFNKANNSASASYVAYPY